MKNEPITRKSAFNHPIGIQESKNAWVISFDSPIAIINRKASIDIAIFRFLCCKTPLYKPTIIIKNDKRINVLAKSK